MPELPMNKVRMQELVESAGVLRNWAGRSLHLIDCSRIPNGKKEHVSFQRNISRSGICPHVRVPPKLE